MQGPATRHSLPLSIAVSHPVDLHDRDADASSDRATPEESYRVFFERNPLPMWVYDTQTLRLLTVNDAAIEHYGYSRDEFLALTIRDIRPVEDIPQLSHVLATIGLKFRSTSSTHHVRQDGSVIDVEIASHAIHFAGRAARLVLAKDVTERKRTEAALIKAETRYRTLLESLPGIVYVAEPNPPYATVYISPAIESLGYTRDEWLANPDHWMRSLHPDDRERVLEQTAAAHTRGQGVTYEYRMLARDGEVHWIHDQGLFVRDAEGVATSWQGVLTDITEQKRAEEALRQGEARLLQSQKMEAVGQLAGGVAHDFNNLLTVINCHTQFLLDATDTSDPQREDVEEIQRAARRAAALTRQLLAFSRKQLLQPRVLDLNTVVANLEPMLQRLIGEDVHMAMIRAPSYCGVMADPGQLEQVLVNLAVNARDAMPSGGMLTIEVASADFEASAGRWQTVPAGSYNVISVSDTGCGMDDEVQSHLFEPFFTTKKQGKGTGLGLPTVYGIVKQSGGHLWVQSEPGHGSTFRIYLPRVAAEAGRPTPAAAMPQIAAGGSETILLVEDEEGVRALAQRVLERHGYTVLEARHGADALRIAASFDGRIDLVLTDVVMPEMGGREMVEALTASRTDVLALFMSGYTDDDIIRRGLLDPGLAFLQKPFTSNALARAVRDLLDCRHPAAQVTSLHDDT
jgi:PAS domain S-box-containing protein